MKKALFFDLDGTLIDSVPDLTYAINNMLKRLGKKRYNEDIVREWIGNGASMLVKRALCGKKEVKNLDENLFKEALNLFLKEYEKNLCINTKLYPNVKDTLEYLYKKYHLSIITNKPYRFVNPILKELKIDNYFKNIIGGDSLNEKKPHPLPLLYLCEKLYLNKNEVYMIGDSKNDILAAKSAGIDSIGVSWGYNYNESIKDLNPTKIVYNFKDLMEIL